MVGIYADDGSQRVTIADVENDAIVFDGAVTIEGDGVFDDTNIVAGLTAIEGVLGDILTELEAQTVLLTSIETNTTPPA